MYSLSLFRFVTLLLLSSLIFSCQSERERRVLVFYQLQNGQAPGGVNIIQQVGQQQSFEVDTTSQPLHLTEEKLQAYSAVAFVNAPGEVLNTRQQTAVERFVQAGGGYLGVASPINAKYTWPWYERLLGRYEPDQVGNPEYQKMPVELMAFEEGNTEEGVTMMKRAYDGGQVCYLAGENVSADLSLPGATELIAEGLNYAIGDNRLDYGRVRSLPVPDENRFVKHVLVPGPLDEPTELTVLPDGKVVFTERKGAVKLYDPIDESVKQIAQLDVHTVFEDGLMGIAKDPNFYDNHWVYMYYSPAGEESVQHLSRFLLLGDSLIMSSEKLILTVDVQREQCCHTGGSITFGPDGNLFLSTGDDTNPFESDGFAPIDERPGRAPFDAQGSSANTNDLRGKVLRIRVNDDATYSIPDGNLFPKNGAEGRPEIYTMGTRNSYRISVDQATGWLYWGDVGNDAKLDDPRGPKGYDEINQAKKAGNFGWPYFRGNQAYRDYDFATGEIGESFNPSAPVNKSVNNTGATVLPPFQKALIWYPYDVSPDFPMLGEEGRNAMAGPVYHYDHYPFGSKRFPEYYDNKLFIYDWMRDWIMAVTLDKNGDLMRIEPFLDSVEFSHIIDMEMGPNGEMYTLEYGNDWFVANNNAMLARIDYSVGNRTPVAYMAADQTAGAPPFTVSFSSEGSFDYDPDDELTYQWSFDQDEVQSDEANPQYTFEQPGVYPVKLTLLDKDGESATETLNIRVGNAPPRVDIALAPSNSFYWEDTPIEYQVSVEDNEDGSLAKGTINAEKVTLAFDYSSTDINTEEDLGHKLASDGVSLIENSGCTACHSYEKQSVGPAYQAVAARYGSDQATKDKLVHKILNGGKGSWGERAMPAQAVSEMEANHIVDYILALDEQTSLPLAGTFTPTAGDGRYEVSVAYTDQGSDAVEPLLGEKKVILRSARVQAEDFDDKVDAERILRKADGYAFIGKMHEGSSLTFNDIDLSGIKGVTLRVATADPGFSLSVRSGEQEVANADLPKTADPWSDPNKAWVEIDASLNNIPAGKRDLHFVVSTSDATSDKAQAAIDWIIFHRGSSQKTAMR